MRFELFISNRFNRSERSNMSRPAVRIAIIGIAIGLAIMLISIAVIVGFKSEVRNQIIGFGSHIQILPYASYDQLDETSLQSSYELEESLKSINGVQNVQRIINKPGIVHTETAFQGILLKGVDSTFNWSFFSHNIIEGNTLENLPDSIRNGAIISKHIANSIGLKVGDKFSSYFVNERLRARRFTVSGIYQTTFSDYDKLYVITDLKYIQQLNGWSADEFSSLEIIVDDYSNLNRIAGDVYTTVGLQVQENQAMHRVETVETLTPQIFDWLDMLDLNAIVVLALMLIVSGFCVVSGLLILILERSATIGLFKALGANNWTIRKIFLAQASHLVFRGVLWGNIIGLTIIAIQYFTHIVPLDPASYYVDYVPVYLSLQSWITLNIGLTITAIAMLVVPSYLVTRISPADSMRSN